MSNEPFSVFTIEIRIKDEDEQTISALRQHSCETRRVPWEMGHSLADILFGFERHLCGKIQEVPDAINDIFAEKLEGG